MFPGELLFAFASGLIGQCPCLLHNFKYFTWWGGGHPFTEVTLLCILSLNSSDIKVFAKKIKNYAHFEIENYLIF